jgi:hypothetical protein
LKRSLAIRPATGRLRKEERRRQEEEARFREDVQATAWTKAQQIRAYIEAVKESALQTAGQIQEESALEKWLAGAEKRADALDPLSQ